MFGLELWFVYAVFSAVAGGIFIFTTKVAAERNYDVVLLSTAALVFSLVPFSIITLIYSDFSGLTGYVLILLVANAILYFAVNVLRHLGLQCLDTAVYYPIYKVLSPLIAIIAAVHIFEDKFSLAEWLGLVLSLLVPVLLISRAEKSRQKDLFRGLWLLAITAVLTTAAAVTIKEATRVMDNIWLFILLADFGIVLMGILVLIYKNSKNPLRDRLKNIRNRSFLWLSFWTGMTSAASFSLLVFAYVDGSLGIVYTINSLYILIPIVLSIIYYHEHWNARKVLAIILSIAALAFLK